MQRFTILCAVAWASTSVLAQQTPNLPGPYTYTTYHVCDVPLQTRADAIVEEDLAPIYDKAVDDGVIMAWGWLAHRTGGIWRRAQYYTVPTVEQIFAAEEIISAQLAASGANTQELGQICNAHEDYIWRTLESSGQPGSPRGTVSLSTYYFCDFSRQGRADEIVRTVLGPIYDQHIGEGEFTTWGWQGHFVGGEYRRMATVTADDYSTLLEARSLFLAAIAENSGAAEFNEICDSHTDYLWDILFETPRVRDEVLPPLEPL